VRSSTDLLLSNYSVAPLPQQSASTAKKRGYKALVDRQVVRVVTPGSLVEDTMLTPEENNYLAALFRGADDVWGLAWADFSTGEFVSTTATSDKLASAILRCSPKEILLPDLLSVDSGGQAHVDAVTAALETALPSSCTRTFRPISSFDERSLGLQQRGTARSSSGPVDPAEHAAVAAILDYVKFTQRSVTPLINAPLHVESSDHMIIDTSAWRSLELAKVKHSTVTEETSSRMS
jgi:DNA mismatch repair protein MutS